MRFTLIGHSCLHAETAAGSILVDPWLWGSCYWRSWWHYPPTEVDDSVSSPDFIYLTHHHFDHFHYPSMRRLKKTAKVLIPEFGVDVMAGEVRALGFDDVTELPHGEVVDLGNGVSVASYQYGIDDSTFVIRDGEHVVADLNDCKIRGRALDDVIETFGRPTFAMKAHSFAQSYPAGYTADDPADLTLVDRATYLDDFTRTMAQLQPDYAVPFGSMVGFLHPESEHVNSFQITPYEVRDHAADIASLPTEVVPMIPGDAWSTDLGFELADKDWYSNRDEHLKRLADEVRPKIDTDLAAEAGRHLEWTDFERFMQRFLAAMPPLTGRLLIKRPICFHNVADAAQPYWCVDVRRGRVWRAATPPTDRADLITVPEAILADAIGDDILGVVHGGMRIRTHLAQGGASSDLAFWGMVAVWELGYLPSPWWKAAIPGGPVLNRRMLRVGWQRRHEVFDIIRAVLGAPFSKGTALERVSEGFGTESTPSKAA
jgi:UDP-MurNAc hydroxylase